MNLSELIKQIPSFVNDVDADTGTPMLMDAAGSFAAAKAIGAADPAAAAKARGDVA